MPKRTKSQAEPKRYKKGYSFSSIPSAQPTTQTRSFIRQRSGDEVKFFDTAISTTLDATGEVPATGGQLVLIPQGDTQSTRDGRVCTVRSVQIRGEMNWAPGAGAIASTHGYMFLVQDKQCNGAPAAVTDVFTSTSLSNNLINMSNSTRFKILKKWVIPFNSPAGVTTAYGNQVKQIEYYAKCNIPLQFSSTTGVIGELKSNNLFLIAGSTTDDLIAFEGQARVRFVG